MIRAPVKRNQSPGNGSIDLEEYCYVLEDFGVSPNDARKAFKLITEVYS